MVFVILPIFIVLFGISAEIVCGGKIIPAGTITTATEILLMFFAAIWLQKCIPKSWQKFILIPVGFLIGDFFYGISNYIFHLGFANKLACLTYVIPYLTSMIMILLLQIKFLKTYKTMILTILGFTVAIGLLVLNTYLIIIPALFFKIPPLITTLKVFAVVFTILESTIVGLSTVLLVIFVSRPIQFALFGVLITHISDIAIRYQS
ncbi:MAG: hypothetical protein HY072_10600, partial [Deltaproteobacteria bacterium]|nr:hypothetical protein [Deltaproteobacteria bacterium]